MKFRLTDMAVLFLSSRVIMMRPKDQGQMKTNSCHLWKVTGRTRTSSDLAVYRSSLQSGLQWKLWARRKCEGRGCGRHVSGEEDSKFQVHSGAKQISIFFKLREATETGSSQQRWESGRDKKNYATLNPIYRVWCRIWCFLQDAIGSYSQVLSRKWNGTTYYIMYIVGYSNHTYI